jgi:hypothetical protein
VPADKRQRSVERLGDLMVAAGNTSEAERLYRDILTSIEATSGQDSPKAESIREKLRLLETDAQ